MQASVLYSKLPTVTPRVMKHLESLWQTHWSLGWSVQPNPTLHPLRHSDAQPWPATTQSSHHMLNNISLLPRSISSNPRIRESSY